MISLQEFRQRAVVTAVVCLRALTSQLAFGASAIVENDEGKVLLVRPRLGHGWALPGGGVSAGEPPAEAILRELREEVGLLESDPPELFALYTRRIAWATNVLALYRIRGARIAFEPNLEISEVRWADPSALPPDTHSAVARRLAEWSGKAMPDGYW